MPPKKTPAKAPAASPQTKKKIVGPKTRKPRNSLTTKTPPKTSNAKAAKAGTKRPVATPSTVKGKRVRKSKFLAPAIQAMNVRLANEVVQAQFPKQQKFLQNLAAQHNNKKPPLKRKRPNDNNNTNSDSVIIIESNEDHTSEESSPVVKKKRIVRKKIKLDTTANNTEEPSQSGIKPTPSPKRKLSLNRKKVFGLVRTIVNDYAPKITVDGDEALDKELQINNSTCEIIKATTYESLSKENEDKDNSRRSSLLGSEFSWTKDLSSSSTTTCVTVNSNDFVRIDNRLPVLKLTKYDQVVPNGKESTTTNTTSTSNSSSSDSSTGKSTEYDLPPNNTLNLSTSSSSEKTNVNCVSVYDKLLDSLKEINLEQLHWSCSEEYSYTVDFIGRLSENNVFQEESGLINLQQNGNSRDITDNTLTSETVQFETSAGDGADVGDDSYSIKKVKETKKHAEEDDDDALSLYAESISGLDMSRKSSSFITETPKAEEYVPQPVVRNVFKMPQAVTYHPSKIPDNSQVNPLRVCEKQNADSTSLRNEFSSDVSVNNFESASHSSKSESEAPISVNRNQTSLLSYKPIELVRSSILRGVCAFNVIDYCKNVKCTFPHTYPDPIEVKERLKRLSEEKFVQEYLLIRNMLKLRCVYGLYFIDECVRRKFSRILLQMSIDFVLKACEGSVTDESLKTEAVERTLLYFNFLDLSEFEDLLNCKIKDDVLLCDVFMKVIGQSQNFARFRTVFINLTMLMCRIGRVFDADVVGQILERVCILPYEFSLNRTLIEILKKTDGKVFENPLCGLLEKRLVATNKHLHDELVKIKQENFEQSRCSADKDIRYSPDTTNYDSKVPRQMEMQQNIQIPFHNHYNNKKPYKRRQPLLQTPTVGLFSRKPISKRPMNTVFASPIFSPSLNPGHLIRQLNKKL